MKLTEAFEKMKKTHIIFIWDNLMCVVFILSVQCVLQPAHGLKGTYLPDGGQAVAGRTVGNQHLLAAAQHGGAVALCGLHFHL